MRLACAGKSTTQAKGLALPLTSGFDDLRKAARVQAGAAHESAVDIALAHELARVLRFYASAVLNANPLGSRIIRHFTQDVTNERVCFLRLLGCGVATGADCPHRFVGDHRFLKFLFIQPFEAGSQLERQYFFNVALVALLERSPMQTIGRSVASCAARTLRLTSSS